MTTLEVEVLQQKYYPAFYDIARKFENRVNTKIRICELFIYTITKTVHVGSNS